MPSGPDCGQRSPSAIPNAALRSRLFVVEGSSRTRIKIHPRYLLIPALALIHLVTSGALLLAGAGASLARFETGTGERSAGLGPASGAVGEALLYPIFAPVNMILGRTLGPVSWMLLIGNSVVWAVALYFLLRLAARRRTRRVRDAAAPPDARILRT